MTQHSTCTLWLADHVSELKEELNKLIEINQFISRISTPRPAPP